MVSGGSWAVNPATVLGRIPNTVICGPLRRSIWICAALSAALGGTAYGAVDLSHPDATGSFANKLYWGNNADGTIDSANIDGSGGGTELDTSGIAVSQPTGTAIDPATNKIYWTDAGTNTISVANLDGSGRAQNLYTEALPGGATVDVPVGIAIDPATNKIYWANTGSPYSIAEANLDGSGGGKDLYTQASPGGATVNGPQGVAIDPAANKIYWANADGDTIAEANLDGSGDGSDLNTTGATTPATPVGVAIDPAANKIYWADANDSKISEANLDGTGDGSDLSTTGASVPNGASGVAIDPAANKIYWTDKFDSKISEANLDGTGDGKDLYTQASPGGAAVHSPDFPALLEAPSGTGAPQLTSSGSTLSCGQATWATDPVGAQLYEDPQNYTYAWTRNGSTVAGATQNTFTASAPGTYACQAIASNLAGSTSQTSTTTFIVPNPPVPSCTLKAQSSQVITNATKHHKATAGKLKLVAHCTQTVHGKLTGTIKAKHGKSKKKSFKPGAVSATLGAGKSVTLTVSLPKAAFIALAGGASESASFSLTATDANGSAHASATITRLKLKKAK
jgi:DNA-binding beta-propeller fold protein YncE